MSTSDLMIDQPPPMLTWDGLYNWATTQQIVGSSNSSYSCPIARYLNAATDEEWTVDDGQAAKLGWLSHNEREVYLLPQWARIVADAVDALEGERITRAQFLRIMDEMQIEEE